tara:strand:+ start:492 stop:764 length:273 start_codon:yes stop_codon:yes gene_type:complete
MFHVKWRALVDEVVDPVREEQGTMALPGHDGWPGRIISREVVLGDRRTDARGDVPFILFFETIGFVFRMACNEQLATVPTCYAVCTGNFR